MKRALVFQHMDHDHPGRFLDFLAEDGLAAEPCRLFEGEAIPSLAPYDFLFVLGGKQDCWEEDIYPWLVAEKQAIREWVMDRARPYFGVCLGHQLLASATGGHVGPALEKEVGICQMELTETGLSHPLMEGVPKRNTVLQWHMAEVKQAGERAQVLASSNRAAVQALAIGDHAMGTQFHCEFTLQTISGWSSLPDYVAALDGHLGAGAHSGFLAETIPHMPEIDRVTRLMYENLARVTGLKK